MLRLRRLLPLVLCFSFCLTVCVLPVSAAKLDVISGTVVSESQTFGLRQNAITSTTRWGWGSVPASFEFDDSGYYEFLWDSASAYTSFYSTVTNAGKTFELMINVSDGTSAVDVSFSEFFAIPFFYIPSGSNAHFTMTGTFDFLVDGNVVTSQSLTDTVIPDYGAWSGEVERYFSLRYTFTDTSINVVEAEPSDGIINQALEVGIFDFTVNDKPVEVDELTLLIQNIDSNISDIKVSVTNIENGVANIDGTVTDMSNQLQDSSSNIWQAAGETISNAVESLFVPSAEDLESVKQGFDDLAKDKLGGAYTAMETVDDTITQVNDKLNNPSASEGIEFPGISVPLGGDIGIVTLAEPQLVVLPTKLTAVLHPVAGTIVSIICGLGAFNVLKDMVECFLSGYSFAEYLHRNKGRSDE